MRSGRRQLPIDPATENLELGLKLRVLRGDRTMRDVAAASGISSGFLSRLEGGLIKRPADDVLLGLARGLEVDPRVIRSDLVFDGSAPPARYLPPAEPELVIPEHLVHVALPVVQRILVTAGLKEMPLVQLERSVRELLLVILKELEEERVSNRI